MKKYFIINKEAEYYKDFVEYRKLETQQRKFINKFFNEYNIEANDYMISGNGFCNVPFDEYDKSEIKLYIIPTDNDEKNFSKMLCKPHDYGLCQFKKSSKISKDFAQRCIDEQIVINLHEPRIGDYIKSLIFRCNTTRFMYDGVIYIKVESDYLTNETVIPVGFDEIKASEYHLKLEEMESKNE